MTTEERVDRLEAVFGQFMTEMAVINRRADERNKAAEERNKAAEERNKAAEERMARFEAEMRAFKDEMSEFKDEMRVSKRELNQKWGQLANKLGTIVEDILAPNLRRLAVEHFRFPVIDDFMVRRSRRHGGGETEFDTIVVGPTAVVLGEAKSTPTRQSAEEFAAKAAQFFDFFPEYRGRRLIAVLGSWAMPGPVVERLTELGVYAMQMGEDTMELVNAAALEAKGGS
ncbi:MAG: hypothetical protein M5U12_04700 [Verrucomicrobia bacterium]|nr:hypothetical protein [Verrucomicrobiota bacterium]